MAEYNESQINSNETERISAEQERIENEAKRQTNETEREARETIRQSNESTRISKEAEREEEHNRKIEEIDALIDELKSGSSGSSEYAHSHTNKAVLDGITANKVTAWDNKSDFNGDYNDLINKPNIPSLDGYATETYVKNEIANAQLGGEGNEVDLSGYATKDDLNTKANIDDIPTKVSQLENDSNYLTSIPEEYITNEELNNKGYLTEHQDISGKADKSEIPTKTSQLTNDSNFLTSVPSEYVTETELESKGYLTEHQSLEDYALKTELPTKTSQLTNDSGYLTEHQNISGKADKSYVDTELAKKSDKTHAHSYNDLSDKPDIPSVDGLATKKELTDGLATKSDTGHTHDQYLTEHQDLSDYALKSEIPTVPTKTSQLTNDSNFISSIPEEYVTETELNAKGYLTEHQNISGKADKSEIPTKTSQLTNDSGYLTSVPSEYITETELNEKGYATTEELNAKADIDDIPTKVSQLTNDSNFLTSVPSEYVTNDKLQEGLANKFDNVEINEAETNDTQTALDFYANGKVVKTVYFTVGGGGNANTPPYVKLLSVENNILGLGEVFNLELDFLSGVTGEGTLKVFINDIGVVSKSIPQGENTIPITDDNFIIGNNRMTLYVIDRAGTMSNSVTLYVRYGSSEIVENEIARYTASDGNTFPIFNSEFTYTHAITNSYGVYQYSIIADSMDNLPTRINFEGKGNLLTVEYFNIKNVTNMSNMFKGCINLTSLDVSDWNTSSVTNMGGMFQNCQSLISLDVSGWDTSKVTNMSYMFSNCTKLTSLNLSNFNTINVTNMQGMFQKCSNLTSLNLSNFDTSKVTDMYAMFSNCNNLTSLDVSNFNTQKVTDMSYMFSNCTKLTSLDLSNFDTNKVTDMGYMFQKCSNLTSLDSMKNIPVSLSLSQTKLDQTSLVDVINNLATVTTTRTLTLGETLLNKLTPEQIAIATNKGWTVE